MLTDEFDYGLPTGLIAQSPAEPRDSCRLMVLERTSGRLSHYRFDELPSLLRYGDLLVVNETRVLPARLSGVKDETGGRVEVLLLRERYEDTWECLVKPGRRLKPGAKVVFGDGLMTGLILDIIDEGGGRLVKFRVADTHRSFLDVVHAIGAVPLPPYIVRPLDDPERYQTVFGRDERSAAAPTAGLHFTPELLDQCVRAGVRVERVELDVGIDTFRPVSEEDPAQHKIHSEHFRVPKAAADAVNEARRQGGRIVAVGTTSVRALESSYDDEAREVVPSEGSTSLFILPGYRFEVTDAVITNFHVPRSTLLMMISAFAGRERVLAAYACAIEKKYRFLSFGDAMMII